MKKSSVHRLEKLLFALLTAALLNLILLFIPLLHQAGETALDSPVIALCKPLKAVFLVCKTPKKTRTLNLLCRNFSLPPQKIFQKIWLHFVLPAI